MPTYCDRITIVTMFAWEHCNALQQKPKHVIRARRVFCNCLNWMLDFCRQNNPWFVINVRAVCSRIFIIFRLCLFFIFYFHYLRWINIHNINRIQWNFHFRKTMHGKLPVFRRYHKRDCLFPPVRQCHLLMHCWFHYFRQQFPLFHYRSRWLYQAALA